MKHIIGILPFLLLAGCQTDKPAATVDITPLVNKIGELEVRADKAEVAIAKKDAAQSVVDQRNDKQRACVRADVEAALMGVKASSPVLIGWALSDAINLLTGTIADPQQLQHWTDILNALNRGDLAKAEELNNQLKLEADDARKQRDAAQKNLVVAKDEAKVASEDAKKARVDMEATKVETERIIAQAKADEDARIQAETRAWQVKVANWAGCGLFVASLALIAMAFLVNAAAKKFGEGAAFALAIAIGCFAFARFLAWPYFFPVVGGGYAVIGAGYVAWKWRAAVKEHEASVKAAKTAAIVPYATMLVDVINEADKKATGDQTAILKALIFDPIKDRDKTGQFDVLRHDLETEEAKAEVKTTPAK